MPVDEYEGIDLAMLQRSLAMARQEEEQMATMTTPEAVWESIRKAALATVNKFSVEKSEAQLVDAFLKTREGASMYEAYMAAKPRP